MPIHAKNSDYIAAADEAAEFAETVATRARFDTFTADLDLTACPAPSPTPAWKGVAREDPALPGTFRPKFGDEEHES